MFVSQEALNWAHPTSAMCRCRKERDIRRLVVEEAEEWMGRFLLAYGTPLAVVYLFRYLGRTLSSSDNKLTAVDHNLQRARGKWIWLEKILEREGDVRRTVGRFYVAVVQAVLIFGSKMLVLTPRLEKYLKGFHHRAVRRMAVMVPKRQ